MRLLPVGLLLISASLSAQPPCTKEQAGQFSPPDALTNRQSRQEAIRCGTLKVCTRNFLKYHWEPVSVPAATARGCPAETEIAKRGPRAVN